MQSGSFRFFPLVLAFVVSGVLMACGSGSSDSGSDASVGAVSSSLVSSSSVSSSSSSLMSSSPAFSSSSRISSSVLSSSLASSLMVSSVISSSRASSSIAFTGKPYKGAEVYSFESRTYGKYVMRMKVALGSGVLSTFFLYKPGSQNPGTFWEEIDIEIFGQNNAVYWESNIIYGSPKKETYLRHTASASLHDNFHTYTLEWTPEYVAWFVNGTQIRRIVGGDAVGSLTSAQTMRFNLWSAFAESWVGYFDPAILPVYQFVNYFEYHSYDDSSKTFSLAWRDDFNSFNSSRWGKAAWTFDDNRVDFVPENITTKDGILILALTHANATGVFPAAPADNE